MLSSLFLTFAQVLLSHVVPGALMSGDISDDMITPSAGGGQLRANIYLKSDFYDVSKKDSISAVQQYIPGIYDYQWEAGAEGRYQGGQWCYSHDDRCHLSNPSHQNNCSNCVHRSKVGLRNYPI